MTSAASLHFGPEWMRKPNNKAPASPGGVLPTTTNGNAANATPPNYSGASMAGPQPTTNGTPTSTGSTSLHTQSSYSSLLASPVPPATTDGDNPFRYSKDQMLAVWRKGGGQGELGLEVARWPGIVNEEAGEPLGLKEFTDEEKRLYAMPYNSDPPALRRRGDSYSHTPLVTSGASFDSARDRNKLASPMRGYGVSGVLGSAGGGSPGAGLGLPGRRKKDENGADVAVYRPRQLSVGGLGGNPPPSGTSLPSPGVGRDSTRPRLGGGSTATGFDGGVMGGDAWGSSRRRVSEPRVPSLGGKDDKLDGPWRGAGDARYRDEITEEPSDNWEDDVPDETTAPNGVASTFVDAVDSEPAEAPSAGFDAPPLTPESMKWVYKDPTGRMQGPFAAPLMQNWYTSGYFTDDLLLQRLDVDPSFDTLQEYKGRVQPPGTVDNLFISPIGPKAPRLPPGLLSASTAAAPPTPVGHSTLPQYGAAIGHQQQQQSIAGTLGHSNGYSIGSLADANSYTSSPSVVSGPFGTNSVSTDTGISSTCGSVGMRSTLSEMDKKREREDFLRGLREQELQRQTSLPPGNSLDNMGRNQSGSLGFGTMSNDSGFGGTPSSFLGQIGGQQPIGHLANESPYATDFGLPPAQHSYDSSAPLTPGYGQPSPFPGQSHFRGVSGGSSALDQLYTPGGGMQGQQQLWAGHPSQGFSNHQLGGFRGSVLDQNTPDSSAWYPIVDPNSNLRPINLDVHAHQGLGPLPQPQSAVSASQDTRHGNFGASIPWVQTPSTVSATHLYATGGFSSTGGQPPLQNTGFETSTQLINQLLQNQPPISHSQSLGLPAVPEATAEEPSPVQAVTDALQDLHVAQEPSPALVLVEAVVHDPIAEEPVPAQISSSSPLTQASVQKSASTSVQKDAAPSSQPSERKRRGAAPTTAASLPFPTPAPAAAPPVEEPEATASLTSPATRPPWSNFVSDDKMTISLRQIQQEAEASRIAELKKLEKEKSVRAATATPLATSQTNSTSSEVTGSWGLPQVGRALPAATPTQSSGTATSVALNVWSTKAAAQASKKTMEEIQAEEKRKAQAVQAQQAQAREASAAQTSAGISASVAAAKRGYADSAKPAGAPSSGGAWATIGAGGKVVAGVSASASASASSTPTPAPRTTGIASLPPRPVNPTPATASLTPTKVTPSKRPSTPSKAPAEEVPPPSLEFIAWMRQALRDLTSANVEEVMNMLLSFPLDPPPSTIDVISDIIYGYSTTLDGRRFASDYVAKRKADAAAVKANGGKANTSAGVAKSTLADVVRAPPPKPAENEWASYKVVSKKKTKNTRGRPE